MWILAKNYINNLWLIHILNFVQIPILSTIYYRSIPSIIFRNFILILAMVYVIFSVAISIYVQPFTVYPTITNTVQSLILCVLPLLFFYYTFKNLQIEKLEKEPMFWISAGLLLYYGINLILLGFSNYFLWQSLQIHSIITTIHAGLVLMYNSILIIVLCLPKQHSTSR